MFNYMVFQWTFLTVSIDELMGLKSKGANDEGNLKAEPGGAKCQRLGPTSPVSPRTGYMTPGTRGPGIG